MTPRQKVLDEAIGIIASEVRRARKLAAETELPGKNVVEVLRAVESMARRVANTIESVQP